MSLPDPHVEPIELTYTLIIMTQDDETHPIVILLPNRKLDEGIHKILHKKRTTGLVDDIWSFRNMIFDTWAHHQVMYYQPIHEHITHTYIIHN